MILLDSNILIYSASSEYAQIRKLFREKNVFVSAISKVEVLGYHKITEDQLRYFNAIFEVVETISISEKVINLAVKLRQQKKLTVGDAIVAATAQLFKCIIYTHNIKDFEHIKTVKVFDPLAS